MAKTGSRLDSGLIVRKGEATPAAPVSAPAQSTEASGVDASIPKGVADTVAVTVRLDQARYERLKMHGAQNRRTNQQILVAALDAYLANHERG
jgi:hypothetical protein